MSKRPLVSAIVIFFNAEKFLEQAIASVLAQDYAAWELLLVDDGSTDTSTAIARAAAKRWCTSDNEIRYIAQPGGQNRGMSAARNLGLSNARGVFVGFLDADDVWLPDKLGQQVALLQDHPRAAMVYGRTRIWHSWQAGSPQPADYCYDLGVPADTLVEPPRLLLQLLQNRHQSPTTCNALVRKSVADSVGGFEDSFRGLYEDQVFFAKLERRFAVYVADACWAKYRQHDASASAEAAVERYYPARRPFIEWLESYLAGQSEQRPEIWRALRREAWKCRHPNVAELLDHGGNLSRRTARRLARMATRPRTDIGGNCDVG